MSKLTIEIEEGPDSSTLCLFVNGEQLGAVSNLKLETGKLDVVVPAIEVDVAKGLSAEELEKAPEKLRNSIAQTVGALRKFRCVEVRAPEGI